jgi:primary-amine oxidase
MRRLYTCLALGLGGTLLFLAGALAQPINGKKDKQPDPDDPPAPAGPANQIVQEFPTFPTKDKDRTAWKVRYATMSGHGLVIQDAWFNRKAGDPKGWVQILGDARLSEAFVPYHRGAPRFWDVSYNFALCVVDKNDAGPHGQLITPPGQRAPTVIKEVRDRGLSWKDARGTRRGETLVLWATLQAANYRYVIEYGFQDDGTVTFRCGSTGHNYPGSEWIGHMHNSLWRVDVNLDGPNHNSVLLCEHIEPGPDGRQGTAQTKTTLIEKEAAFDFDPVKFTSLRVIHTKKQNARKQPWAYDLIVSRMGNSRHFGGEKEDCTLHDYWVTRAKANEIQYPRVPHFLKDGENVEDTDVCLWISTPGHHEPRAEDGEMTAGKGRRFEGATPIMWCGFELRPRDFWDRSAFFPYAK